MIFGLLCFSNEPRFDVMDMSPKFSVDRDAIARLQINLGHFLLTSCGF